MIGSIINLVLSVRVHREVCACNNFVHTQSVTVTVRTQFFFKILRVQIVVHCTVHMIVHRTLRTHILFWAATFSYSKQGD